MLVFQIERLRIEDQSLQQRTIRFHRIPPHRLSYSRKRDLFEADGFGIVEPEQTKSSEVRCQQRNAHRKPLLRHYKQQEPAVHKPTVGVLEKEQLHALVVKRSDLRVVRRVEVQERERLYLDVSVEEVPMYSLDPRPGSGERPLRIKLNAIASTWKISSNEMQSCSRPYTRIDC